MRFLLMICVAAIFAAGLLMIFSTTSAEVLEHDLNPGAPQAILKQLYYAVAGVFLAVFAHKFGYDRFLRYSPQILLVSTIFLILVLIPGIGREVNGSRRWIAVAGLSFQPSEFVKYVVPAFFINSLIKDKSSDWTFLRFIKLISVPIVPIALILVEPNNGTAAVVAMTVTLLCFLTSIPMKFWAIPLLVLALVGVAFASQLPYVAARLTSYLHPERDLKGKGHQPYQAKIAVGSGGLLGRGPGNSLQKMSYLPEAQNDYIGAIFAEELGFLGIVGLLSLYAIISCIGFYIATHAGGNGGAFLAATIVFLICFQAFLNLGVVSGILPSTGLNLPFFSQGGSSLMANLMGVGLLLSILRKEGVYVR